ncbi:MAG: hypothetical protein ACXVXI_05040 [Mycobacteriaceae bacterium]
MRARFESSRPLRQRDAAHTATRRHVISTRKSYTTDTDLDIGWFDLDAATLIAADDTEWVGNLLISRATGSQRVRESLVRTAGGEHVIETDNSDGRSAALGLSYRRVSPGDAEMWLRRQGLHATADEYFAVVEERGPGVRA